MKPTHITRLLIAAAFALVIAGSAAPAGARTLAAAGFGPSWHVSKCLQFDWDDPIVCGLLHRGFRGVDGVTGAGGPQGAQGAQGAQGISGIDGVVGNQGPIGDPGPQGPRGGIGPQGVKGADGAFVNGGPNYHTVIVLGTKIGPFPGAPPNTGQELPASVARCQVSGINTEAYDGGVRITTSGANSATDIVTLESSFPGIYVSQSEVDPLPSGGTPGAVSSQPANAYEAQPVITQLASSDLVTYQAYVVCGP